MLNLLFKLIVTAESLIFATAVPSNSVPFEIVAEITPMPSYPTPTESPRALIPVMPTTDITPKQNTSEETKVLSMLNTYRLLNSKKTVVPENQTCELAEKRVQDIKTDWSHSKFRSSLGNIKGNSRGIWVENLAKDANENNVLGAWINSPTHNKNLLADIDFACIRSSENYWALEGWKTI